MNALVQYGKFKAAGKKVRTRKEILDQYYADHKREWTGHGIRKRAKIGYIWPAHGHPNNGKHIISVDSAVTSTTTNTLVYTATFPFTLFGLRWNLACRNTDISFSQEVLWCIVMKRAGVPDGDLIISKTDGTDTFTPEENVFACGVFSVSILNGNGGPILHHIEGKCMTKRKYRDGDSLHFLTNSNINVGARVRGIIQFFHKS